MTFNEIFFNIKQAQIRNHDIIKFGGSLGDIPLDIWTFLSIYPIYLLFIFIIIGSFFWKKYSVFHNLLVSDGNKFFVILDKIGRFIGYSFLKLQLIVFIFAFVILILVGIGLLILQFFIK